MPRPRKESEKDILKRLGLEKPGAVDQWITAQLRELGEPEPTEAESRAHRASIAKVAKRSPPACIAASAAPVSKADRTAAVKAYGEMVTVFAVRRDPRAKRPVALPVWGVPADDPPLTDPICIGGPTRAKAAFWFDSRKHGYDGEFGHAARRRVGTPEPYHCPECGHDQFRVTAVFQYSGENEELDKPEHVARVQDFFSWFFLRGTCDKCGASRELASVECA